MLIGWTSELKRRVVLPNIKKLKTAELHKQNTIEYDVANDSLKLIESYQKSTLKKSGCWSVLGNTNISFENTPKLDDVRTIYLNKKDSHIIPTFIQRAARQQNWNATQKYFQRFDYFEKAEFDRYNIMRL